MNLRENLINSTQPALVVKAILISTFITLIMGAVSWYQLDEYETENPYWIPHAAAIYICKEQWPGITDKAAYNLCVDKEFQSRKSERDKRVANPVKKEMPSFISFILKDIDEVLIFTAIIAAGVYFTIFTYILYAKCNHLGWKRLSIIFAFIAGFVGAFIVYDEAGSSISSQEYFGISLGALAGYISAIFILLGGRQVVAWIKEGFNPPQ